jgi:hypothetical protein
MHNADTHVFMLGAPPTMYPVEIFSSLRCNSL